MRIVSIITVLILFTLPLILTSSSYESRETTHHEILNSQYSVHLPILITDNSDFSLLGFPGSGTASDPYLIEGFNITQAYRAISISETNVYFIIRHCYLQSITGGAAVSLEQVDYGLIEDCIIDGGTYGVHLHYCRWTRIENNMIVGANDEGIQSNNGEFIDITGNNVFANEIGIYLNGADNSSVYGNRVYSNSRIGIEIASYARFNELYQNYIGWNVGPYSLTGERNAVDNGENNTWHHNRWSDHISPTLYHIEGDANSLDDNPMTLRDDVEPVIFAYGADQIIQGNNTEILNWTIIEDFPFSYEAYQNGDLIEGGYLCWDSISIPLGELPAGEYNFTIRVNDGYGNFESRQHFMEVIPETDNLSILLAGVGIGVILVVLVIWEKIIRPRRSL